jgi:hypothetical protein
MSERTLGAIVQDIAGSLRGIVRLEIRMAVSELRRSVVNARAGMMLTAVGSIALLYAVGVLLLSAVYGLSLILAPWLAALSVGVALAAVGGIAVILGVRRWSAVQLPRKTIASVQETVHELRHELDRA